MKKLLVLILSFTTLAFTLTACGSTSFDFDGAYWKTAPAAGQEATETLTYAVEVNNTTLSNTNVLQGEAKLTLDESSYYKTTFDTVDFNGDERYYFKTELYIKGAYVKGDESYPVEDKTTSETWFKLFRDELAPVKTVKTVENNTVYLGSGYKYPTIEFAYNYEVTYDNGNATVNFNVVKDEHNALTSLSGETKYKNIDKKPYVDNELLFFVPRAYDLTKGLTKTVNSVDVAGKSLRALNLNANASDAKNVKLADGYTENGQSTPDKTEISCVKLSIEINDTFSGRPIEAYFATATDEKHRPTLIYTAINGNIGYLTYRLKSVEYAAKT